MSGLTDFLLARIAEDEAVAREWPEDPGPPPEGYPFWIDPHGHPIYQPRGRVLAECDAKRRIVDHYAHLMQPGEPDISPEYDDGYIDATEFALKIVALPYADHPDYRPEWAPLASV